MATYGRRLTTRTTTRTGGTRRTQRLTASSAWRTRRGRCCCIRRALRIVRSPVASTGRTALPSADRRVPERRFARSRSVRPLPARHRRRRRRRHNAVMISLGRAADRQPGGRKRVIVESRCRRRQRRRSKSLYRDGRRADRTWRAERRIKRTRDENLMEAIEAASKDPTSLPDRATSANRMFGAESRAIYPTRCVHRDS